MPPVKNFPTPNAQHTTKAPFRKFLTVMVGLPVFGLRCKPCAESYFAHTNYKGTNMSYYSIIYNNTSIVALPAVDVLTDIAMEKGWKILHSDVDFFSLQQYKDIFNMEVMDAGRFHLDYLAEELMTEEDTLYIEAQMQSSFYEQTMGAAPDADEEEFDESFSSFEDLEETEEE